MSQRQHEKPAAGEQNPKASDRREFIRQSLGVAPLMLTLGGRSDPAGVSMHGTLWSSLGTMWKHKGNWWRFKTDRWRWTKSSGEHWRERDAPAPREWKKDDWRPDDKVVTEPRNWEWGKAKVVQQRELGAESKRTDLNRKRRSEKPATKRSYDWRQDDDWKRSEGLSPLASDGSNHKRD